MDILTVSSPGMDEGTAMPQRYANAKSGGDNMSPPVSVDGLPDDTRSVAMLLVDPDARDFVHWAVVDVPPGQAQLAQGAAGRALAAEARELRTTAGTHGYYGPNPPAGSGPHRYQLNVWALAVPSLDVPDGSDAATFIAIVDRNAIAKGSTFWTYENR